MSIFDRAVTNLYNFARQRHGLGVGRTMLLGFKLAEFAGRRMFSDSFQMRDIWGVRRQFDGRDPMGFRTSVGVYELEEQIFFSKLFALGEPNVVVDVGSAMGTFTNLFACLSSQSKIFSFEPNPYSRKFQAHQLGLNGAEKRVTIFGAGLGEKSETLQFKYVDGPQGSLWGRFADDHVAADALQAEVPVLVFDDLPEVMQAGRVDVIKIDIEGAELPALRGMKKTIIADKPIICCEMALSFMVEMDGNIYRDTLRFFDDIGYEVFILGEGRIQPYTWPQGRVMNWILLPREGGGDLVSAVRRHLM